MSGPQLRAESSLDTTKFDSGIDRMKSKAASAAKDVSASGGLISKGFAIGGAIGAGVGIISSVARSVTDWATQLKDQSEQTGVSIEKIQQYSIVARKSGQSVEVVTNALGKLRNAQAKVIEGDKGAADSFAALGISAEEVASLGPDQLLQRVAKAYTEANGAAKEYGATADLLGSRTLPQLTGVLAELSGGLEKASEGHDIIPESTIVAIDRADKQLASFVDRMKGYLAVGAVGVGKLFSGMSLQDIVDENTQAVQQQKAKEEEAQRKTAERNKASMAATAAAKDAKIKSDLADIAARVKPGSISSDSAASVGGMIGGSVNPAIRLAEKEAEISKQQADYLKKIENNTRSTTARTTE